MLPMSVDTSSRYASDTDRVSHTFDMWEASDGEAVLEARGVSPRFLYELVQAMAVQQDLDHPIKKRPG